MTKAAATKAATKKRTRRERPDRFEAIAVLFLRVLQRDSTEAPAVMVSPGRGATWVAAVFIGKPPAELLESYLRGGTPGSAIPARAPMVGDAWRVATESTGTKALEKLERELREAIAFRLAGDLGAWVRAFGKGFPRPKLSTLKPTPADPHVQAPGDFPARPRPALGPRPGG